MRSGFLGYYAPTANQYEDLWSEALIVLDTNVLLNLYQLPAATRDELIHALELLKDRLWIPYHVALEFQKRRLDVIAYERKSTEDALTSTAALFADLKKKIESLQMDKRGLEIKSDPLVENLERENKKLLDAIRSVHMSQPDIASSDPIRDKLDEILFERVGQGPKNQAELDKLISDGEQRYSAEIPPGFEDSKKEKSPKDAVFFHDHIKYERKFGDLILWKQLISHVKNNNVKKVLLVTADQKEDWWWKKQNRVIGAHPELVREIHREGGVDLFWMYSYVQFVEHANKYASASVSSESVAELRQVTSLRSVRDEFLDSSRPINVLHRDKFSSTNHGYLSSPESIVSDWLRDLGGEAFVNADGFPDIYSVYGTDVYGYEIKRLRHFAEMTVPPSVINSMMRGYLEEKEGRMDGFAIILLVTDDDYLEIIGSGKFEILEKRLSNLLEKYPVSAIAVGCISEGVFVPLAISGAHADKLFPSA